LNPCTFGIPEGNARTIASYSLVGGHLVFYLLYINAEIKQSARKGFYRTVKEWFGKFQAKIPIEYLGMIGPEKFTMPFCLGCRGLFTHQIKSQILVSYWMR
jgi:hypothetical protein